MQSEREALALGQLRFEDLRTPFSFELGIHHREFANKLHVTISTHFSKETPTLNPYEWLVIDNSFKVMKNEEFMEEYQIFPTQKTRVGAFRM